MKMIHTYKMSSVLKVFKSMDKKCYLKALITNNARKILHIYPQYKRYSYHPYYHIIISFNFSSVLYHFQHYSKLIPIPLVFNAKYKHMYEVEEDNS